MRGVIFLIFAVFSLASTGSFAKETKAQHQPLSSSIQTKIKKLLPGTTITSITKAPMGNLYEVVMGKNVAYVDPNAKYLLFGHIFDVRTQQDITQERIDALNKVDFTKLPLDAAIEIVKGNGGAGKRIFALFTDPECPYCRQLEVNLAGVDNYTMYVFLYPIKDLHPGAPAIASAIWCSSDRAATFHKALVEGLDEKSISSGGCEAPIEAVQALGQSLGVNGTPTLIHIDGRRAPGAMPGPVLDGWLNGNPVN